MNRTEKCKCFNFSIPEMSSSTRRYTPIELIEKPANQIEIYDKLRDMTRKVNERIRDFIEAKERLMHKHFLIRLQEMGIHFDETSKESYKDVRLEYHRHKIKVFKGYLFIIEFDSIQEDFLTISNKQQ